MSQISNSSIDLIVVLGPTATGKTKLAVQLAHKLGGEIISADSRQVYSGMNIGTGKDLDEYELSGNPILYHLVDILYPMEKYNVARFQNDFHRVFSEIRDRNKLPILCGGTGFYIKAVLMDFQLPTIVPNKKLRDELENWTLKELIHKLDNISPGVSSNSLIDTKRRVIRAIEVTMNIDKDKGIKSKTKSEVQTPLVIGIKYPRDVIRQRITRRLYERFENGMIEEVEYLLQNGMTHERLNSLGLEYRFISKYLQGDIIKDKMITQLNTAIHRFAKKQMTFLRNMEKNGIKINWISEGNLKAALKLINK